MFDPVQTFSEMSCGDAAAESFCHSFFEWVHTQDDLYDRDQTVTPEQVALTSLRLLATVASNPFFQKHKDVLLPVMNMSALAWADSERLAKDERVLERIASQVLKSQYLDVFLQVAWLTGGALHAVAMSKKYRDYAFDPVTPASLSR